MMIAPKGPCLKRSYLLYAVSLCALVALAVGCAETASRESTARQLDPEARRVFIFAVDGLTWRVLDPLLEKGELPNIARLIETGAAGELKTLVPSHSPVVWTSIATGKSPEKHGIKGFWYDIEEGEYEASQEEKDYLERLRSIGYIGGPAGGQENTPLKAMYHSGKRTALNLWDILGQSGVRSDVIAWWMSYPADEIRGRMISDRYIFNRFELGSKFNLRLYAKDGRHVHPEALEAEVRPLVLRVEDVTEAQMQRFIRGAVNVPEEFAVNAVEDELRIVLAKDTSFVRMSEFMLSKEVPGLVALYIQGPDIASHYFWKYRFPAEWREKYPDAPIDDAEIERYGEVIDEYYRLMDEWIGRILEFADERSTVVVLSDHGFETGRRTGQRKGNMSARTVSGVHSRNSPPGILVVSGAGIRRDVKIEGAHVYDVAPTLLALFGLPVAEDMDGKVLEQILDQSVIRLPREDSVIPTYELSR